jgi:hypothetical protein
MGPLLHSVKSVDAGRDTGDAAPFAGAEPYTKGLSICAIGQKRVLWLRRHLLW